MTYHFGNDRFTNPEIERNFEPSEAVRKSVATRITEQPKNYYVFGYNTDGKLIPMSQDGFSELSLALEYLSTIDAHWRAFVSVRLTNV